MQSTIGASSTSAAALSERERRQFVSELFHALSQPLTALRCSLEMALSGRFAPGPSEENLRLALAHSEQIAHLATGIRELLEAEAPGSARAVVSLESALGEAVADLAPVAESAGVQLTFRALGRCPVLAEPRRLRQALFYLVESALASAEAGGSVRVETAVREPQAMVLLAIGGKVAMMSSQGVTPWPGTTAEERRRDLGRRLGLAIASRTFEAAGGRLYAEQDQGCLRLRLTLPLAGEAS